MRHTMDYRKVLGIALLSTVALSGTGPTLAESAAPVTDYRLFKFSPERPYYVEDGKVDFGTYNGFRRYHAECHVCHGPAGLGSSYAPALMKSMQVLSFDEFTTVVIQGRQGQDNRVMPAFAANQNVLPYISDIYAYLKARADGAIGTARPNNFPKVTPEPKAAAPAPVAPAQG